jgi:hypothetical protein
MTISKNVRNSVCERPRRFEATIKCPVEETGMNSVRPSTIPRRSAWKIFI